MSTPPAIVILSLKKSVGQTGKYQGSVDNYTWSSDLAVPIRHSFDFLSSDGRIEATLVNRNRTARRSVDVPLLARLCHKTAARGDHATLFCELLGFRADSLVCMCPSRARCTSASITASALRQQGTSLTASDDNRVVGLGHRTPMFGGLGTPRPRLNKSCPPFFGGIADRGKCNCMCGATATARPWARKLQPLLSPE